VKEVVKTYNPSNVIIAPTKTVYKDELGREIRSSVVSFSGTEVHADTVYDAQGRTIRKSEPFFNGASTIYWTDVEYDLLDRPLETTRPDAGVQTVVYNGLTETSTNELNQIKTVKKDALGRMASVTDHLTTKTLYVYDAIGQLTSTSVNGVSGTTSSYTYDIRGNKITDSDPDKGNWSYSYNALGQLASQTDAKSQVTSMTYDLLGRMLTRIDDATAANPSQRTSTWVYDTAPLGSGGAQAKGKLASVSMPNYAATYAYDAYLRDSSVTETIETVNYTMSTTYDAGSRPSTVTYPSGLVIENTYNAQGYLASVKKSGTSTIYWTANTADERGNITQFQLGNGVTTTKAFDAQRGWVKSIVSQKGSNPLLQNLTFTFNKLGNLTRRADGEFGATPLTEDILYDGLNRLTKSTTVQAGSGGFTSVVDVAYDTLGNITSKSDVGTYTYNQAISGCGGIAGGKHALTTVVGTKNATYCYDLNGNIVAEKNGSTTLRSLTWSAFDLPTSIIKGTTTVSFAYGPDRARYKRVDSTPSGTTTTIYAGGKSYEVISRPDASLEKKHYIGDFAIVTDKTVSGSTTTTTAYLSTDHLGSVDVISDSAGALSQKMSFDAWGKRRETNWTVMADPSLFNSALHTTRGFTGHEEIDPVGLVHMNGRVYDAELGRFLSADPVVQDLSNLQSWNRYTYVLNNPLSMTDPTGFFFGSVFKAIGNFISKVFSAIGSALKSALAIPLVRAIIQIAACAGPQALAACVAVSGALVLASGGSIEEALTSMAFTIGSFGAWEFVGTFISAPLRAAMSGADKILNGAEIVGFAAAKGTIHGVVGGALSVAQGGDFVDGFVANAAGAAAGVASEGVFGAAGTGGTQGFVGRVSVAAIAGGSASALTGGKFANGAITAAFAQMWNAEDSAASVQRKLEVLIFEPVGYGESSFGHVAVIGDGQAYSFGPSGMFIATAEEYMSKNAFRGAIGYDLILSNREISSIESYLRNYKTPYSFLTNNCTTPIQSALASVGVGLNSTILPRVLSNTLAASSLYRSATLYTHGAPFQTVPRNQFLGAWGQLQ
jgi:RHS repeat-associated protein